MCIASYAELADICRKMNDAKAEVCFITNAAGEWDGFITAAEIANKEKLTGKSVSPEKVQAMALNQKQAVVQETFLLRDALSLMLELNTDYLGVFDRNEPVGMITLSDIRQHSSRKGGE